MSSTENAFIGMATIPMETSKGYGTLYRFMEDDERMKYYRQAAAHGNLIAIKELAFFLKHGKGIAKDCREALKWYLIAASFNDIESVFAAGDMYRDGVGTEQNLLKAIELYKTIANNRRVGIIDRKRAANKIAYVYENVIEDGHAAVKRLKKAVLFGDKQSRFRIAEIYRDGRGLEPSGTDALEWFNKILRDKTLPDCDRYAAAFEIAQMFYVGKAVPKNDVEAVKYFKLSAKAGTVTARAAYNTLAKIYCTSAELTPNIGMALHWLKKAADAGSYDAARTVAKIFRDGKFGVRQSGEKALAMLNAPASDQIDTMNRVDAMRMLANMYDRGLGVPEDKQKAATLYQEATSISADRIRAINGLQCPA